MLKSRVSTMAFTRQRSSRPLELLLLLSIAHICIIDAFLPRQRVRVDPKNQFSCGGALSASTASSVEEAVDQASLVLRADYVGESSPAPVTSQEAMVDFFRDPKHSSCLITAANTRESHVVPSNNELLTKWKKRASILGAAEPKESDVIISVRTGGIKFPGVTVESTSLIGSTVLLPTESNHFPSYEFVLIQDQREASGLKPIVWVFNQLVGVGNKDREKDASPMSLSRVAPYPTVDDPEKITFKIESFLEIKVKFPSVLLKILPVSKEKAEAQGADAVRKVLAKDIDVSIEKFRDIYVESLHLE